MAVIYDRSARTFIVTLDSERAQVRQHHAQPGRATACSESSRTLRRGGQEVLNVVKNAAPVMLSSGQIRTSLPHVSPATLRMRLLSMATRGYLKRTTYSNYSHQGSVCGRFKEFLYGLTTAAST